MGDSSVMNRMLESQADVPTIHLAALPTPVRKRVLDLGVSVPATLLTLPIILVMAIGSALAFRAWPLFVHERLGRGGRAFRFVKIRTLPTSTPAYTDKYTLETVQHSRWGDRLRATHLDELPQFWLVLTGRMSLVGPRPEMRSLADTFDPEFVRERLTVLPGCTGLWQISESVAGLIGEAPELDLHYIRHWTFRLDLWILCRTALQLFGGAAIKNVTDVPKWTGAHTLVTR
jgi:lipopolysaccharide/colanic/teichoic acid biosynthesis glycosyltransferase